MTLESSIQKINSLQHLVGQNVPIWDSPILEIIPAPANELFSKYIEIFKRTGNITKATYIVSHNNFDVLLIFKTPKLHGDLVYEWYSYFYPEHY
jgi:hypothetical protein